MKKIILLLILCSTFVLVSTSFALKTFSDDGTADFESSAIGATMFKPSPKVTVCVLADNTTFEVAAKHIGGNRVYSSAEDNPGVTVTDEMVLIKGEKITAVDKTGGLTVTFND